VTNDVLNSLIDEFDIFEFNDDKFEELKKEADALRINFDKMTADYKISLLDNKKFSFEFEESDISDIFGKIIECEDESGSEATIQLVIKDFTKFREMKELELSPNPCQILIEISMRFSRESHEISLRSQSFLKRLSRESHCVLKEISMRFSFTSRSTCTARGTCTTSSTRGTSGSFTTSGT